MNTFSNTSKEEIQRLSTITKFDNALSTKYKKAINFGIPVRYIIQKNNILLSILNYNSPKYNNETDEEDNFENEMKEEENLIEYENIFTKIRSIIKENQNITLLSLWKYFMNFPEFIYKQFIVSDFIYVWLHAIPEYRINNPMIFNQIKEFTNETRQPLNENDMSKILIQYTEWLNNFNNELERDYTKFLEFVQVTNDLISITPCYTSPFKLTSKSIIYEYTTEKGINPLPEIFANAKVSYIVPFIKYNIQNVINSEDPGAAKYKIYAGKSNDARPLYINSVLQNDRSLNKLYTIYLNVWTEPKPEDEDDFEYEAQYGKKEGFKLVEISYFPEKNYLKVSLDSPYKDNVITEQDIIERLHQHLPTLPNPLLLSYNPSLPFIEVSGNRIREVEVGGSFSVFDVNYIEFLFIDLLFLNRLFSTYLYIDETGQPYPDKSNISINFRGLNQGNKVQASAVTKFFKKLIPVGEKLGTSVGTEFVVTNPLASLNIEVVRAGSQKTVSIFIDILSRLLQKYKEMELSKINEYMYIMPKIANFIVYSRDTFSNEEEKPIHSSPIAELRKNAPDLIVHGYARLCQKKQHPKIISNNEIGYWQNQPVLVNGQYQARQIMPYPLAPGVTPKYNFVCPGNEYPFPGILKNTNLSNRKTYPFIPCCYDRNHMDDISSKFNSYRLGYSSQNRVGLKKDHGDQHVMSGAKLLEQGRDGMIPKEIETYLAKYKEDEYESVFLRFGTTNYHENTFIHCLFRAFQIPSYMALNDLEERKEYVDTFRENLFIANPKIHASLVKQELYDMTYKEIEDYATDNSQFFDPLHFYRILEELFSCNIFIFSYNANETSHLQVPRYKIFHSHVYRSNLPAVLILRHYGATGSEKILKYPTCELIYEKIGESKPFEYKYIFEDPMSENLFSVLNYIGRTMTWSIFETRNNIYSLFNYREIFGKIPIVAQVLDSNGKARMFCIAPQLNIDNTFSNLRLFINILPTAPLNIPEFDPLITPENSIILPTYKDCIEMFGNPSFKSLNVNETEVVGFWFPVGDIEYGIYCQIVPISIELLQQIGLSIENLRNGSDMTSRTVTITSKENIIENSSIQRTKYLRKAASILSHLIKYLYITQMQSTYNITPLDFLKSIGLLYDTSNTTQSIDSVKIYDIRNVPRILPLGTVNQILANLAKTSPNLFPQNKVIIYGSEMLNGLIYMLNKFRKNIEGLNFTPNDFREIPNYYEYRTDYPQSEDTFLLMTTKEFNSWLKIYYEPSKMASNLKDHIQMTLSPSSYLFPEPYIYYGGNLNPDTIAQQDYYIVQNVAVGDFLRAINVAYTWIKHKINLGYAAEKYKFEESPDIPAHIIYKIGPDSRLAIEIDKRILGKNYVEILNYGQNYAALLKL